MVDQRDAPIPKPPKRRRKRLLGTPFKVFLSGGITVKINKITRKETTEFIDLPGLLAALVKSRVMHPRKLSGDDLKYIRSALALKSSVVAKALDMSPEHYSRCENGTKTMSSSAEKFYRMFVYLGASCRDKDLLEASKEERAKAIEPEKANEAMAAFWKLFMEMKIQSLHSAGEKLEFSLLFRRDCPPECDDCGDNEGEWKDEADRKAA